MMYSYIVKYFLGLRDRERIEKINNELLSPEMPVVKNGVLYLDGEGTATAAVAKRAAELFNEGAYSSVVMAGGMNPHKDWKSRFVFPRVEADNLPLPLESDVTEADYLLSAFQKFANPKKFDQYQKEKNIHIIGEGNNAGAKIKACKKYFEGAGLVQAVTLAYTVPRLIGTFSKEIPDIVVTGERVFPFGLTKEKWPEWFLSYGVVMQEADKTGPRMDKKKPDYEDKYFVRTDLKEAGVHALQKDKALTP